MSDLLLAVQVQMLTCRFNIAMVFQRLINKVSHLLLGSEVITYHPDGLVYPTDASWGQAVCPNDLEILIQHLASFMLKCNSSRIQTQRLLFVPAQTLYHVGYRPVACCPCQLRLSHHFVAAGRTRVIFTVILIWKVSAVIVTITQKSPLYACACNQNQERQKDTVSLRPDSLSFS